MSPLDLLTVVELKKQLRSLNLPVTGRKAELIARLQDHHIPALTPPNPPLTFRFLISSTVLWFSVATSFYMRINNWSVAQSFYHATDTGLSIGSGRMEEIDDTSRAFTIIHVIVGSSLIAAALALLLDLVMAHFIDEILDNTKSPWKNGWMHASWLNYALLLWISVGVLYGTLFEKWSIISALYYTVTMLSTAGCLNPTNADGPLYFTAFFAIIGVPIYGAVLGRIVSSIVEPFGSKKIYQRIVNRKNVRRDDFFHKSSMDFGEFLALELRRERLVDHAVIEAIKFKFQTLARGNDKIYAVEY